MSTLLLLLLRLFLFLDLLRLRSLLILYVFFPGHKTEPVRRLRIPLHYSMSYYEDTYFLG